MCGRRRNQKAQSSLENKRINVDVLPPEIIQKILARLPIVYLPACRLVCKAWNDLVLEHASTSKFVANTFFVCTEIVVDMQPRLTMHCIDLDTKHPEGMNSLASFRLDHRWLNARISNSCNGLLCVFEGTEDYETTTSRVAILNPMTNEYIEVLGDEDGEEGDEDGDEVEIYYGFGFSPRTKQYKIARVSIYSSVYSTSVVEIFTIDGSKEWRLVDSVALEIYSHGIYFDGGIYWVVGDEEEDKVLCRLDVENEKIEVVSPPLVFGPNYDSDSVYIGVFNGCLYASFCMSMFLKMEVWMMHPDDDEGEYSWKKAYVINGIPKDLVSEPPWRGSSGQLQLIKAYENGEILCLVNEIIFFLSDQKTGRVKIVNQDNANKKNWWVYQIESFNFDSLQRILLGDS